MPQSNWKDKTCERCIHKGINKRIQYCTQSGKPFSECKVISLSFAGDYTYISACAEYKEINDATK